MSELDAYLRPMSVAGDTLRFDLSSYRSTVTREMLQLRLRMTAQAFGAGSEVVAASLTSDRSALEVDARALSGANAAVRSSLESGPDGALDLLRELASSAVTLARVAGSIGARLSRGRAPEREMLVAYIMASGHDQALGALKFCLPEDLRPRVAAWVGDPALVEALLSPEAPSLWSVLGAIELALARVRLREPAATYRRRLVRHRRAFGYLFAEDIDFRASESLEAIDARLAALAAGGDCALASERRRLAQALAADRADKVRARQAFAESQASRPGDGETLTLVSHVLLARRLAGHEDTNRRAKMRLLRDLRDLAEMTGLPLERVGLLELVAACPSRRHRPARKAGERHEPVASREPVSTSP